MSPQSSRRGTLRTCGLALATALTGCSGTVFDRGNRITRRQFAVLEYGTAAHEAAPDVHEDPAVAFDPEANRVTVTGSLYVGSSSCSKAVLERVRYDRDADTLRVRVGSGPKGIVGRIGLACTGDMSADSYRATVDLSDRLPGRVVVTEGEGESARTTTVRPSDDD